jgi:predicted ABC-type ATPase
VRRRYHTGLRNLFRLYSPLADEWWLYDGSKLPPKPIAHEKGGKFVMAQPSLSRRIARAAEGKSHE